MLYTKTLTQARENPHAPFLSIAKAKTTQAPSIPAKIINNKFFNELNTAVYTASDLMNYLNFTAGFLAFRCGVWFRQFLSAKRLFRFSICRYPSQPTRHMFRNLTNLRICLPPYIFGNNHPTRVRLDGKLKRNWNS